MFLILQRTPGGDNALGRISDTVNPVGRFFPVGVFIIIFKQLFGHIKLALLGAKHNSEDGKVSAPFPEAG